MRWMTWRAISARPLPEELRLRLREFYRYKFSHHSLEDWHSLVGPVHSVPVPAASSVPVLATSSVSVLATSSTA